MKIVKPFLTPSPDGWRPGPWILVSAHGEEPLGRTVPTWDYESTLHLRRQVTIDPAAIRGSTQLPEHAALALSASWRGTRSNRTARAIDPVLIRGDEVEEHTMDFQVDGRFLTGRLTLECRVVLAVDLDDAPPGAATKGGSVLLEDRQEIVLEGEGSRFPTQLVSFRAVGLDPDAVWSLELPDSLSQATMGGLCLLLNSDNEDVVKAMDLPEDHATVTPLTGLRDQIAAQMVRHALRNAEQLQVSDSSDPEDEPTLATTLVLLLGQLFPKQSVADLAATADYDPGRFETIMQGAIRRHGGLG